MDMKWTPFFSLLGNTLLSINTFLSSTLSSLNFFFIIIIILY